MPDITGRVESDFEFHPANATTGPVHSNVREILGTVALRLIQLVPEGREQSLMLTKLEEAMFWANAAVARHS